MRKRLRELKRQYPKAKIDTTGGGHYRLVFPDGRKFTASATPSCWRTDKNFKKQIRRQT